MAQKSPPWEDQRLASNGRPVMDNFKEWFRRSVVQENGVPLRVFHGTTNDFDSFDIERVELESHFGRGFYFSNTPSDVAANYAGEGLDLVNRIKRLAEQLQTFEDLTDDESLERARQQLSQQLPNTMAAFLRIENPILVGGEGETFFDYITHEATVQGAAPAPSGTLTRIFEALRKIDTATIACYHPEVLIADLLAEAKNTKGLSVSRFLEIADASKGLVHAEDWSAMGLCNGEIVRAGFEGAGFDGIIDRSVHDKFNYLAGLTPQTVHYMVFSADQVKSATGNSGLYLEGPSLTDTSAALALERAAQARQATFSKPKEMAP